MGGGYHGGFGGTGGAAAGDAVFKSSPEQFFKNAARRADKDRNGVFDVVAHGNGHSCEDNADIASGLGEDVLTHVYQTEKWVKEDQTGKCQHGGSDEAEGERRGHGLLHFFLVLGAEEPRRDQSEAGSKAVQKSDDGGIQRGSGSHGGKGLLAQKLPHDAGVGQVIELLEKVPQQKGYGKEDDQLHRSALCKIFHYITILLNISYCAICKNETGRFCAYSRLQDSIALCGEQCNEII